MPVYSVVIRVEKIYEVAAKDGEEAIKKARANMSNGIPPEAEEESGDSPTASERLI